MQYVDVSLKPCHELSSDSIVMRSYTKAGRDDSADVYVWLVEVSSDGKTVIRKLFLRSCPSLKAGAVCEQRVELNKSGSTYVVATTAQPRGAAFSNTMWQARDGMQAPRFTW